MPNPPDDPRILITVTGHPSKGPGFPSNGQYHSSSDKVKRDGTITLDPGTTTVEFDRGTQGWCFEYPWITFSPDPKSFTVDTASCNADKVVFNDDDPGGPGNLEYQYTLHTDRGTFDPEIINKG